MNEQQKRDKLEKLRAQKEKIDSEIEDLEDELPSKVSTRGDPIVRFH